MQIENAIIHVINHDTEETFQIVGLAHFLEFLNDNDDIYSFSTDKREITKFLEGA